MFPVEDDVVKEEMDVIVHQRFRRLKLATTVPWKDRKHRISLRQERP
jgi:hypothetical protein